MRANLGTFIQLDIMEQKANGKVQWNNKVTGPIQRHQDGTLNLAPTQSILKSMNTISIQAPHSNFTSNPFPFSNTCFWQNNLLGNVGWTNKLTVTFSLTPCSS
mmetsp:Transcript_19841/g.32033  ORF Transcript_19841/g.32033 Transcript_19841/m.32033 type:complete len:103 (+) Transcript_19841:680-988(+)